MTENPAHFQQTMFVNCNKIPFIQSAELYECECYSVSDGKVTVWLVL